MVVYSPVHMHARLRKYGAGAICLRNDCGALQPVCTGCLLLGRWRATGDVRHRLGYSGSLLSCWHRNRDWDDMSCGQLLRRRGRKRGYVRVDRTGW